MDQTRRRGGRRREGRIARRLVAGLLFACVAVALGCRTIVVKTDYDSNVDYLELQRFAWLEPPEVEDAHPFADNTLLRKRVRGAIENALAARGYRRVERVEDADFLATYSVILEERIRDDGSISVGYGGYRGYRRYGFGTVFSSPSITNYQESTLIIDLLDPSTEELLWRGWGSGVVGTRDRERSVERIQDGVRQILDRFPPDD